MTKAFALKISMKALIFFVVFLQYNKNRCRLTDLLDSLFFLFYMHLFLAQLTTRILHTFKTSIHHISLQTDT